MPNPGFYCTKFIEHQNSLPKYQPKPCLSQCHSCMDEVLDHHFNKTVLKKEFQKPKS